MIIIDAAVNSSQKILPNPVADPASPGAATPSLGQDTPSPDSPILPNWLPFAFIPARANFDDIPEGFRRIPVAPGASLVDPNRLFSPALAETIGEGGVFFLPNTALDWFNLIQTRPEHPFCLKLQQRQRSAHVRTLHFHPQTLSLIPPRIMAIWNVSPDSSSSACDHDTPFSTEHAQKLCDQGADILDIGAESTRPMSTPLHPDDEWRRLELALRWARTHTSIPISLDSRHPQNIERALQQKLIDIVNDVALTQTPSTEREAALYKTVATYHAGLVLMAWNPHSAPETTFPLCLQNIVTQLAQRLQLAWDMGCDMRSILVDPGIGFGKGLDNDLALITKAPCALAALGRPVLIAHSRKRCLAKAVGIPMPLQKNDQVRIDIATATSAAAAFQAGAAAVRVHNPELTRIARRTSCGAAP